MLTVTYSDKFCNHIVFTLTQCLVKDLKMDATSAEVLNLKIRAAEYFPLCPTFSSQVQVLESVA